MRFALTSALITGVVLIFLNIVCSEYSQEMFYQSKKDALLSTAQLTANEVSGNEILTSATASAAISRLGHNNLDRIIITDASGLILYDSCGEPDQVTFALFPQLTIALSGNDIFTWHYYDGVIRSVAASPIVGSDSINGCVYLLEYDIQQGHLIQSLLSGIFVVTLLLESCLLLFAFIYARRYSKRIRKIMASMRTIQQGDYSHKVQLSGHDELSVLGQEFNDLTARLQISEKKRHQFVSDASHELKTPLASIKLLTDSILQNDMDPETVREFVSDIGDEAERLNRMTLKLLALTKGEVHTGHPENEIILMAPTINRVIKMLSSIAQENMITLRMDLRQDSHVLIQEDDLYQIAYNLVENGIKYNVRGGTLTISLHQQEDSAILRISDTGIGIPADSINHVFERFFRVDKARSRESGGSGLGLAIVRAMVERNHGEITLQSIVGKGTTFTVAFPRFDIEEAQG